MELKLILKNNRLVRIPEAIIVGEHKKVVIKVESDIYNLGTITACIRNGHKEGSQIIKNKCIDITEFCDRACKIEIKIDLIAHGYAIKSWWLEPLLVRELDTKFELIPEIKAMEQDLVELSKELEKIKNYLFEVV